jgi:hypothetical protein
MPGGVYVFQGNALLPSSGLKKQAASLPVHGNFTFYFHRTLYFIVGSSTSVFYVA